MSDYLIVGRIGAPHGVRGWSLLTSLTDPQENLLDYGPLWLEGPDGWEPLVEVQFQRKGEKLLIRCGDHEDRDQAEALRGRQLGLAEADLPAPAKEEFYWRDLIGLTACSAAGQSLGRVVRLIETGAHDVLVIAPEAPGAAEVLVPFVPQFTGAVDLAARTIVIDWPEFDDATEA